MERRAMSSRSSIADELTSAQVGERDQLKLLNYSNDTDFDKRYNRSKSVYCPCY